MQFGLSFWTEACQTSSSVHATEDSRGIFYSDFACVNRGHIEPFLCTATCSSAVSFG